MRKFYKIKSLEDEIEINGKMFEFDPNLTDHYDMMSEKSWLRLKKEQNSRGRKIIYVKFPEGDDTYIFSYYPNTKNIGA